MANMSWQLNKTVLENHEYMLTNEIMCDVTFLMGKNKTPVRCHTYMLVSRSPVFFAMFSGEWTTTTTNQIEIPDIEPEIMKLLLRYVYTEKCPLSGQNVMGILYGAKKYNIQDLEKKCASFLEDNICAENVFVILDQARVYDEEDLSSKCKEYIFLNASESLKSGGFKTIHKDTLAEIISCDNLAVHDELEVYDACKRWATAQCETEEVSPENIREALGEVLFMIRFPLLSADVFTKHVSFDNILNSDEQMKIFRYLSAKGEIDLFNANKRLLGKPKYAERFIGTTNSWIHNDNDIDAISFSISKKAHLAGVSLYLPSSNCTVAGDFMILENGKILLSKYVTLTYRGDITEDVLFEKPLMLQPGMKYTLSQQFKGKNTYGGLNGKEHVEVGHVKITFIESERDRNGTSVTQGQLPRLLLCLPVTY